MPSKRRCKGTNQAGEPCKSPFVRENGYCSAHGPGAAERMQLRGYQGAKASKASKRKDSPLDDDELPPLTSFENAEVWTDTIGRALATGRLNASTGNAMLRAVREWREARSDGAVSDQLDALTSALNEWRQTGSPERVLALVEGKAS